MTRRWWSPSTRRSSSGRPWWEQPPGSAGRGLVAVVAGLDVTFEGTPFEPLPSLMALAERVDKLTAVCAVCAEVAVFHARRSVSTSPDLVAEHVGSQERNEARCRRHFPLR